MSLLFPEKDENDENDEKDVEAPKSSKPPCKGSTG